MTTFVYSKFKAQADAWAHTQGLHPTDCRTYGDYSMWDGHRYHSGDRVVILGAVSKRVETTVARLLTRCDDPKPTLERITNAGTPAGQRERTS